jgi:hypothetical protein
MKILATNKGERTIVAGAEEAQKEEPCELPRQFQRILELKKD